MRNSLPVYHVVSHTHWDPEWYLTCRQFRIRLVHLMDKLLEIMKRNPKYGPFMLDGQTQILESYLSMRPERAEEARALVRDGRLLAGPWYLMPELFMLSGECHIRNLQYGIQRARTFGPEMKVGYLCDAPGFISQLPQILQGFHIPAACGWRGIAGYPDTDKTPFWMEGPDASRVLMLALPWSYGTAGDLGADPDKAEAVLAEIERLERPFSATGDLLLMDGNDHREPVEGIGQAVDALNRARKDIRLVSSSLERFAKEALASGKKFKTHRGELRATLNAYVFASGILASRMNVKQASFRCLAELEKYAEPLTAVRWASGGEDAGKALEDSWRLMLLNAFHDVIYGGHVDGVTEDALNRYRQSFESADWLAREALSGIAYAVGAGQGRYGVVLFNPTGWDYSGVVELDLLLDVAAQERCESYCANGDGQETRTHPYVLPALRSFTLVDAEGTEVPFQINRREVALLNTDESGRGVHRTGRRLVERVSIALRTDGVPAMGYRKLSVLPANESESYRKIVCRLENELHLSHVEGCESRSLLPPKPDLRGADLRGNIGFEAASDLTLAPGGAACENAFLKMTIHADGSLDVLDKASGRTHRGLHLFEDSGDVGDLYFFHAPESNALITSGGKSAEISVVRRGPVEIQFKVAMTLELPAAATPEQSARTEERVACDISSLISMQSQSRRIDFRTTVINRSRDHRLRVLFPTGIPGKTCHADSIFDVVERERLPEFRSHWREKTLGYNPQSLFLDLSDGKRGVAFFNKGLPQYQVLADGTYCLTLFRAVSHLGKYHLPEYGNNGTMLCDACFPTPSAQMPGEGVYEYAAYFHSGDWSEGRAYVEAQRFCYPPLVTQTFPDHAAAQPALPPEGSFARVEPDECVLSAVKRSADGKALIVRFYNITSRKLRARVTLWKEFARCVRTNLAEERAGKPVTKSGNTLSLDVRGHEIVTLRLEGIAERVGGE